jgi:phage tail sheath protein FI
LVRGHLLDARTPGDRDEIVARQRRLVDLADVHRRFVALLDVPPGLDLRGILSWRARFDSTYAAAYHPWLAVLPAAGAGSVALPAAGAQRVLLPPSAFAAGIVAARERLFGLPWGPANELARGAVLATAEVTAAEHDQLHPAGINVFRPEPDGYRLTAARTLGSDRYLRQLSVRRLMTMLRLALDRQMQWVVFEPNTPELRELLRHRLLAFLRELYRGGAFTGGSEQEAFFVKAEEGLNPPESLGLGRLVVQIGVAPAEPLEFLVLRITREGDGGVRVDEGSSDG